MASPGERRGEEGRKFEGTEETLEGDGLTVLTMVIIS